MNTLYLHIREVDNVLFQPDLFDVRGQMNRQTFSLANLEIHNVRNLEVSVFTMYHRDIMNVHYISIMQKNLLQNKRLGAWGPLQ